MDVWPGARLGVDLDDREEQRATVMKEVPPLLLAGDVGGTKTNLGIFSSIAGLRAPLVEATFPSRRYPSLEVLVSEFLDRAQVSVDRASFGVAGPVTGGRAAVTNLPWVIEEVRLQESLRISSVHLLNDVNALAIAIPKLESDDLFTLKGSEMVPEGTRAVIAPGTGLGEAFLTWDGDGYHVHPSEGGHADFAPTTRLEQELLQYLAKRFDHVSIERVASGRGIRNIYDFLKERDGATEPDWLRLKLAKTEDPVPVIINTALDREESCELCTGTLDLFTSILGSEAGNMALKVLAIGGVYLGGGIPPRILPSLTDDRFLEAFRCKGRFADLLSRIPIHVVLNPKAALWGAARYGLEMMPHP